MAQGDRLFLGLRSGTVQVLDGNTLELRYLLRGKGGTSAPITFLRDGTAVVGFDTKRLQGYVHLP